MCPSDSTDRYHSQIESRDTHTLKAETLTNTLKAETLTLKAETLTNTLKAETLRRYHTKSRDAYAH